LENCGFFVFLAATTDCTIHGTKSIGKFNGFGIHGFNFLLNKLRIKFEDRLLYPNRIILIKILNHPPQINIRLNTGDSSFQLGKLNLLPHSQHRNILINNFLNFFEVG
jgi:hypothetical protein